MISKFNKLYNIIMEELQIDTESNEKYQSLLSKIKNAPLFRDLEYIYKTNKEFIDNNENLILALINNGNAIHLFKNQFRTCPYKKVQDWFAEEDRKYNNSSYLNDADQEYYNAFTNGEGDFFN